MDATGIYINFFRINKLILLPVYNQEEDEMVIELFPRIFPVMKIRTIYAREIAENGGILNCISWNINI